MVVVDLLYNNLVEYLKQIYKYSYKEAECLADYIDECYTDSEFNFPVDIHIANVQFHIISPNEDVNSYKSLYDVEKCDFIEFKTYNGYTYLEII